MRPAAQELAALLDPNRVVILTATALLTERLARGWTDAQHHQFLHALHDRERLTPTAIGKGIAVPHARVDHLEACCLALAVIPSGVDWEARDGQPVRIAIGIAAREQQRTEHLHLLALVAKTLGDPQRREALLVATDTAGVLAALK
jgi:mannitol/fructose-specific phosphotransferase system IIA component